MGLRSRLDYVQALGVDCIWMLPCYPSPLKDNGYDVADYTDIHPHLGNIQDLVDLVHAGLYTLELLFLYLVFGAHTPSGCGSGPEWG